MKRKAEKSVWSWVPPTDKEEPATSVTQQSCAEFRNGLLKLARIKENRDFIKTIAYRAALDLDHLKRLLEATPGTIISTFKFEIRPKTIKDAKRIARELKKSRRSTR